MSEAATSSHASPADSHFGEQPQTFFPLCCGEVILLRGGLIVEHLAHFSQELFLIELSASL